MRLHRLAVLALLATLPLAAGHRRENHTLKLKSGGTLRVVTGNSPIEVQGWDREEVALTADIQENGDRPVRLELRPAEGRLEIEAVFPERSWGFHFGRGSSCAFTLQVPRRLVAEFRTSNASIAAKGFGGQLRFRTSNARLELSDLSGEVEVHTSNGRIEARRVDGDLRGGTSNARLDLEQVSGAVDLSTSNGSVRASQLDGRGKGIRLHTSNGGMTVELGKATGEIHAKTSSHEKVKVERQGLELLDMGRGHNLRLRAPGSTQAIELRTSNGGITIR